MGYPPVGKGRGGTAPAGRGQPGPPGHDGITPRIGSNGHWFIGNTDTGVSAKGDTDDRAIISVSQTGNTLTFTHGDGAKHTVSFTPGSDIDPTQLKSEIERTELVMAQDGKDIVALKKSLGDLTHHVDSLTGVYSYRGQTPPTSYPADLKSAYFINLHNSNGPQTMYIPDEQSLGNDGTVLFINNENDTAPINVNSYPGIALDNASNAIVGPLQFHMWVKHGNDWITAATGYIPSSLDDVIHRVAATMTGQLHTKNQIVDIDNQWLANPTTQSTLDKIMTQLGYTKGSGGGTQPHPSTVKVHYGTSDGYPADFTGEVGEFAPHQNLVVNHLDQNPKHVWIAVPASMKSKVVGVVANNGMPAQWGSQDISVKGEQWTVFLSPTPLADDHISFSIKWSV
ncbi:hypothetical protein vBVpaS1601_64 [Vibrio phage vB_VpaS_1601]|uniref:hypothetical protein n=1 Tax=Vibrio phage SHOU24 TaxID=1414739 RepID=UPI0003ED1D7D|nr:hypothetical protein SHOU24_17 [Vibrio phage SHOU24]AHI61214.1 hypothetical protein SHOU24_17 [Vibrio phage SHOU24]WHM52757.1 hypothetical protein vBVpaP1601_64 [Vibrio phage vB_VpaP_1601]